jgi:hypothetical protein
MATVRSAVLIPRRRLPPVVPLPPLFLWEIRHRRTQDVGVERQWELGPQGRMGVLSLPRLWGEVSPRGRMGGSRFPPNLCGKSARRAGWAVGARRDCNRPSPDRTVIARLPTGCVP